MNLIFMVCFLRLIALEWRINMALLSGVYLAKKKNGETYYRSSITYQQKHISLGSYKTEEEAHKAYLEASKLVNREGDDPITLEEYSKDFILPFEKWVVLINFRDNGMYIKNPIYLKNRYFLYYIDEITQLKFDVDDLFYYSEHKIMVRGGHLFVADYGMQVTIASRYGIKNYAVVGKDYRFVNGDGTDYRYGNIEIINHYHGVSKQIKNGKSIYLVKIHIRGDYLVGRYTSEIEAAVAYNKAVDFVKKKGCKKKFSSNYISELTNEEYARLYHNISISKKIRNMEGESF